MSRADYNNVRNDARYASNRDQVNRRDQYNETRRSARYASERDKTSDVHRRVENRDLSRTMKEYGPNSPKEVMNPNVNDVNDPLTRGYRVLYSATVDNVDEIDTVTEVRFGLPLSEEYIIFSLRRLPPPRGTEVWLLGFQNQDLGVPVETGITFASKQDAVDMLRSIKNDTRSFAALSTAEKTVLEYLNDVVSETDNNFIDLANSFAKNEPLSDRQRFVFQAIQLP